ncbi:MAG: hypothetical protein ABIS51_19090 [Sphingomonas sp.]
MAPSKLAAAEGPILTLLEAADGTQITGKTDAGSTVTVTFVNGAIQLVKQASVTGTDFTVSLTAAEIEMLGEGYVKYSAVASMGGIDSAPSPTSQIFFTHQPIVDALTRLDSAGSPAALNSESSIGVTPLKGGGFAVRWVVDGNGDSIADGLAVQLYAADGSKQGAPTILQGLSNSLLAHSDHVTALDLAALEGGGFALSYSVEQERSTQFAALIGRAGGPTLGVPILGRPVSIAIPNVLPGVTFSLGGIGTAGTSVTIPLTVQQDGTIAITQPILDQISAQDRTILWVGGLPQGQTFNVFIQAAEDVFYDPASALHSVSRSANVGAPPGALSGSATLALPTPGRVEAFHIDAATFAAGANHTYVVLINMVNPYAIDLNGTPGAVFAPDGRIQIFVTPDADGNVAVPQSILNQIGTHDASISLAVIGLQLGTTLTGSVAVRDGISQPEGVFVQHFGADGVALGDAGTRIDMGGTAVAFGTDSPLAGTALGVTPLDGGGYAVRWVTDSNADGVQDGLAVQRYGADGAKQGGVTVLQGLSNTLTAHGENLASFDLVALGNGGYALSYAMAHKSFGHAVTLTAAVANQTLAIPIVGRPTSFIINSAPAGASFDLAGTGNGGTPVTIPLTVQNGAITITQAILDQLGIDNRMTLRVTGVPQNGSIQVGINVQEDVSYDSSSALHSISRGATATGPQGATSGTAVLSVPDARAESFHIDSAIFAAGATPSYLLIITPIQGGAAFPIGGISGAVLLSTGQIQIIVTPDANGNIAVSPQILGQLGDDDATISLVVRGLQIGSTLSGTIGVHDAIAAPSGVFIQTFGPDGVALNDGNVAISDSASPPASDAENGVGVTPLDGGGFVVRWAVDKDGDGNADGLAVQRYGADGAKQGGATLLQGVSGNFIAHGEHLGPMDFAALANGGYALSYTFQPARFGRFETVTAGAANQTLAVPIVGRPTELHIYGPLNAILTLTGTGNAGNQVSVHLTAQNGVVTITQAILNQFGIDDRLTLLVTGLNAGESAGVSIDTVEDTTFDPNGAPHDIRQNSVAMQGLNQGTATLGSPTGRAEAFHIDSATFAAGATPSYMLVIDPIQSGQFLKIGGIAGATLNAHNQIQIVVTPDANGNITVPKAILDQLGVHDGTISLVVSGLEIGSALSGTISVLDPIHQGAGVYVQTFGADGVAVSADLHLVGGNTDDVLLGDIGNDTLSGSGGNDRLDGGAGHDYMAGGIGDDIYVIDNVGDIVFERANEGNDTIETSLNNYVLGETSNVENLTLIGSAVTGSGNALDNILTGNALANTLYGNGGNDRIDGGGGTDTLIGGLGDDLYVITDSAAVIVENAGEGNDTIKSSVSYVLGTGVEVETVRLVGTANLDLTGNTGSQSLGGNSGNNVIDGGGGGDNMKGGAGNDAYIVRSAADRVVEVAGDGDDTVKVAVSYTLGAAAQVEHLVTLDATATTAINLTGNAYSHDIQGNAGVNVLTGGSGNDILDGGTGADQMQGGAGSDSYIVDDGADTVFEANSSGVDYDTVTAYVSWTLAAGQEVERLRAGPGTDPINLTGNEFAQKVQGNDGANILLGGGGNDVIIAAGGDDTLKGGTGLDKLTGGLGADTFVFEHGGQMDQIVDFAVGTDKADLTAFGLTWQDVQAAMTESNGNTILTLGGGDSVVFAGVSEASLSASDFLLGGNILSNTLQSDMWDGGRDDMLHAQIHTPHTMFEWHLL